MKTETATAELIFVKKINIHDVRKLMVFPKNVLCCGAVHAREAMALGSTRPGLGDQDGF